jgi:proteasomal ATPase-associated factor 1
VERGRNVLSVSRDATVKLWDVGQSQCLSTFEDIGGVINACSLSDVSSDISLGCPTVEHCTFTSDF